MPPTYMKTHGRDAFSDAGEAFAERYCVLEKFITVVNIVIMLI
jgi:hypothetical protein